MSMFKIIIGHEIQASVFVVIRVLEHVQELVALYERAPFRQEPLESDHQLRMLPEENDDSVDRIDVACLVRAVTLDDQHKLPVCVAITYSLDVPDVAAGVGLPVCRHIVRGEKGRLEFVLALVESHAHRLLVVHVQHENLSVCVSRRDFGHETTEEYIQHVPVIGEQVGNVTDNVEFIDALL